MATSDLDLLRGTVDILILQTLSWGPQHGFGVARAIRQATDGDLQLEDSALYPALHRMEEKDWIDAEWGLTENGRRAKFYSLTTQGRAELRRQSSTWARYAAAVAKVMQLTSQPA
jgi:PadR family transcriptional regulator, regulatory protein PadR